MDARKRRRQGEGYGCEWTPDWRSGMRSQVDLPYYGFDHVELATFHGDQVHGDYARWLAERHPAPDTLRGRDNALPDPRYSAPQAWRTRLPASLYPSAWVGERACEWLHGHAGQKAEQPFFFRFHFPTHTIRSHHPASSGISIGRKTLRYPPVFTRMGSPNLSTMFTAIPGKVAHVRAMVPSVSVRANVRKFLL